MPPRLGHRKSRTGCSECKRRRVKCDEQKPKCSNCVKYEKDCSITKLSTTPPLKPQVGTSTPPLISHSIEDGHRTSYSRYEVELIHWFTTFTAQTLNVGPDTGRMWSVVAVQEAFKFEFLMDALLAVSSLHKSIQDQANSHQLVTTARNSIDRSLARVKPALSAVNEENCHALFLFSALVASYAIGVSGNHPEKRGTAIAGFLEALWLIQGSALIVGEYRSVCAKGPIRSIFGAEENFPKTAKSTTDNFKRKFKALWIALSDDRNSQTEIMLFQHLLSKLEHEIEFSLQTGHTLLSLKWLATLSAEFIGLLQLPDPRALAITAVFVPLMQNLNDVWIFGSWHRWLGTEIKQMLAGTEWEGVVEDVVVELESSIQSLR